ncbi:hypothetical protein WG947_03335 [Pontibacter sp. H259]|uniref:hypothetical protein n=1 Tax=Pontibacter sp. H259 TaxID=3133421 RepID=UPI0030C40140
MKAATGDRLLAKLGRVYLHIRLRDQAKIERELTIKYNNQYRNVGLMLLFDVFMALAVLAIVGILTIVIYFTTT